MKKTLTSYLKISFLLPFCFIASFANAQNLISNPGFETNTYKDYWSEWQGTASVVNANAHSGNHALQLQTSGVTIYQDIPVKVGVEYTAKFWVKNDVGAEIYVGVEVNGIKYQRALISNVYQEVTIKFIPQVGFSKAQIYVYKYDILKSYVDDVSVTSNEPPCADCLDGGAGNYYVSTLGNDNNNGTSIQTAWRTINKVNKVNFKAGDKVSFEGGKTFEGTILLNEKDLGSVAKPVTITSYGAGRATINGKNQSSIELTRASNVIVDVLNCIGSGRKTGNTADGISLYKCNNIKITQADVSGFQHSGINVMISDDVFIKNVNAFNNGYAGINSFGVLKGKRNKKLYIGYSKLTSNLGDPSLLTEQSGNGIITGETDDVIIEYCEAAHNGGDMPWTKNGPVGIWSWNGNNILIQNCIAHHNKTSPGAKDGGGFDIDGGMTNSMIQYCLSYENQGSGYGVFQFPSSLGATTWANNTVRYCISENDGVLNGDGGVFIWNGSLTADEFSNFKFYNNVIYNDKVAPIAFDSHLNKNFAFYNNVFISNGSTIKIPANPAEIIGSEKFLGNCYYTIGGGFNMGGQTNFTTWRQASGQETMNGMAVGMSQNPFFKKMGPSTLTDPLQIKNSLDYQINSNSPLIDKGLNLQALLGINVGPFDYFGNSLQNLKSDIGVHESLFGLPTGLISDELNQIIDIYPNPSNNGVFNFSESADWKVFSVLGMELKSGNSNQINLSENPKGVYFIKLNEKIERVVVE